MADSRKGSTSSDPLDTQSEETRVARPPIRFVTEAQTLSQILQRYDLPRVVQCDVTTQSAFASTGATIDFSQPLLFFKRRSVRKVSAHSLVRDGEKGDFTGVGNDLLIPEDFKGYFAVLGHPDDCHVDHVIPYFRQAGKLAISPCIQFLVGGDKPVNALRVEGGMRSDVKPVPCQLFPGEVLRKGGIFQATSKVKIKGKGLFRRKKSEERKEYFLQCFDQSDREVLLPDSTLGTFVVLVQEGCSMKYPVVTMKELLERYKLPLIVKLVYGRVPDTPCSFTGTILLSESGVDRTIIASTIFNFRNINMEIPINADFHFYVVEHTPGLMGCRAYASAYSMCERQADTYMRNMKVCYLRKDVADESSITNPPDMDNDLLPDVVPARSQIGRSASVISRTSVWSNIISSVNITEREYGIFVPSSQRTPPPNRQPPLRLSHRGKRASEGQGGTGHNSGNHEPSAVMVNKTNEMKEVTMFQRPKPPNAEIIRITTSRTQTASETRTIETGPYNTISEDVSSEEYASLWDVSNEKSSPITLICDNPRETSEASYSCDDPGYNLAPIFTGVKETDSKQSPVDNGATSEHNTSFVNQRRVPPPVKPRLKRSQSDGQVSAKSQSQDLTSVDTAIIDEEGDDIVVYENLKSLCLLGKYPLPSPESSNKDESTVSEASSIELQPEINRAFSVPFDYRESGTTYRDETDDTTNSEVERQLRRHSLVEYSQLDPGGFTSNVYQSFSQAKELAVDHAENPFAHNNPHQEDDHYDKPNNYALSKIQNLAERMDDKTMEKDDSISHGSGILNELRRQVSGHESHSSVSQSSIENRSSHKVSADSMDPLVDVEQAGLQARTIQALREIPRETLDIILQSDMEVEDLRSLLPQVSGIDLRKVLMYLKGKLANT